jgi:hypothetical protein
VGKASAGKKAAKTGGTRGHTVPQMYLRHFAEHRARRQYELRVRRLDDPDKAFPGATVKTCGSPIDCLRLSRGQTWRIR